MLILLESEVKWVRSFLYKNEAILNISLLLFYVERLERVTYFKRFLFQRGCSHAYNAAPFFLNCQFGKRRDPSQDGSACRAMTLCLSYS